MQVLSYIPALLLAYKIDIVKIAFLLGREILNSRVM